MSIGEYKSSMENFHRILIAAPILASGSIPNAQSQRTMGTGYFAEIGYSPT